MRTRNQSQRRQGVQAVEAAVVLSVVVFLLLGIVVVGMGVFRYQQVACQAREAARWACLRAADFQRDTDQESPTRDEIFQQAVLPMAFGMDPNQFTLHVQWVDMSTNTAHDWDGAAKDVKSITAGGEYVTNRVRVTVNYQWSPGLFFDPVTLSSVCELPLSN